MLKSQKIDLLSLEKFSNIFIIDSTSWDIAENLKWIFPGSGGSASKANCKLQFCYNYLDGEIIIYDDVKGKEPDQKYSPNLLKYVKEYSLFLFDLGYWNFTTFFGINEQNAFFLSRFYTQVNLWVKENGEFIKLKLEDILEKFDAPNINLDNLYIIKNGKYVKVRLVSFKLPEEQTNRNRQKAIKNGKKKGYTPRDKTLQLAAYSIYVTNAPEELISNEMIRSFYRLRWNVELIFKSFKSVLKIHKTNVRKNANRLRCEIYARLILVAVVHKVHNYIHLHLWNSERRELSLDKFWKYIKEMRTECYKKIRKSMKIFLKYIESQYDNIVRSCEKYHQKSRNTTLQLIDKQIGDGISTKITREMLIDRGFILLG